VTLHGTEAQLLRAVQAALMLTGGGKCIVLRLNSGVVAIKQDGRSRMFRGCEPGTPDLLVVLPGGRTVWLELKSEKGRVTAEQVDWHRRARNLGHTVAIVRNIEDALCAVWPA
jgi:hypothetical protein